MRKLIPILIAALVLITFAGCDRQDAAPAATGYVPGQTVEAYNYVHGGYVGRAVVTTNSDGSMTAELDEAFLPHTLAIVDMDAAEWNENNTAYYVQRNRQVRVAKYIRYNGTNYTGVTVGSALSYVASDDQGNPVGGTDLEMIIIRNEANMATYWSNIGDGKFEIMTEFGGTPIPVTTTSYGSVYKRGSTYWVVDGALGWPGNIEAVEQAAVEHGLSYGIDEMVRGEENLWRLADAVTGATLSDFPDYFALIQTASARLKTR